ncbi:hypothetical protein HHI36_005554 [Cryptolaemus montrouzieri]|uniref:Uncharacterized protein n=1 Tax=Cryptolaemus montrouzieri TaxID=559131 RepID=A0ABD2NUY8_9CUCU
MDQMLQNFANLEIKIMAQIADINAAHSRNFEEISLEMEENAKNLRKIQDNFEQKYLELSREMATLKMSNVEVTEKGRTTQTVRVRLPEFDGSKPWEIYFKQFEANLHFEHVYFAQLNNRIQGREETLRI